MTTLARNESRTLELGDHRGVPCVAADIVYEGSFVGDNGSGLGRPLVAADPLLGLCVEECDNSLGAAGDKNIRVLKKGCVELDVTGITGVDDVSATVYASDDNTFTLTSTSNTAIGKVSRFVEGTTVMVEFEANYEQSL